MTIRDPVLVPTAIADLRPTQVTVGFREVAEKRREWAERAGKNGPEFLGRHAVPVITGPHGRPYVIDHHHLARALLDAGQDTIAVNVVADLSRLCKDEFWAFADNRGWCHPYDAEGVRQGFDAIPKTIAALVDDPFRSLAGELRRAGGYAKDTTPFSEFIWADFLRRRIEATMVTAQFSAALTRALALAHDKAADHLPGWCGAIVTG